MIHVVKDEGGIFDITNPVHNDRIHVLDEAGNVLRSYRFEQVWGTNSHAVLFTREERKRRFEDWLSGLQDS